MPNQTPALAPGRAPPSPVTARCWQAGLRLLLGLALLVLGLAMLVLAGCAVAPPVPEGPVLVGAGVIDPARPQRVSPASPEQLLRGVSLQRAGQAVPARPGLALAPGDRLATDAQTLALIDFPDGHRVYVLPGSRIQLGSVRLDIGEILVSLDQAIAKLRSKFKVETSFVTAGVDGTEFWVRASPGDRVELGVVEGRVQLASVQQAWAPLAVGPGQAYRTVGAAAPVGIPQREQVDSIVRLVSRMRLELLRLAPPPALPPRQR